MSYGLDWPVGIDRQFDEAIADQLEVLAVEIMDASQELVPVLSGDLKSSGYIISDRKNLTVKFGYKAPHAYLVHDKQAKHSNGEMKYLEKVVLRLRDRLPVLVNTAIALAAKGKRWKKAKTGDLAKYDWDNYSRPKHSSRTKK